MCSFFMYIDSSDCRLKIYLSIQYIDLIPYLFRSLVLSLSVRFLYTLYNIQVFEECLPAFKDCSHFLEKFVTWPRDCGRAIMKCESNCPQP